MLLQAAAKCYLSIIVCSGRGQYFRAFLVVFQIFFSIGILSLYTLCIKIVRQHSFFCIPISIIISEFHIFFYQNDTKKTTFGKNEILCGKATYCKGKKIIYIFCHTKIYLVKTLLCDCNSLDCIMYVPK